MRDTEATEIRIGRDLVMKRRDLEDVSLIALDGAIDESLESEPLTSNLREKVLFNLEKVKKINSHGVRQWSSTISRVESPYYGFLHCGPGIVLQLNMVAGFGGRGEVLSLFLPFICPECDLEALVFVDLVQNPEVARGGALPKAKCRDCACNMLFDDLPEVYFSHVSSVAPPSPPESVREVLATLEDGRTTG